MSEQERTVRRTTKEVPAAETTVDRDAVIVDPLAVSYETFTEFVREQIEKMQDSLMFKDREPSMYELQVSLSNWESVWFGLVSLYETARWEHQASKEDYDLWWAAKFMDVKNRANNESVKRNTWLSATEIEATVMTENAVEIRKMKAKILEAEGRKDTMSRLMDGWSNFSFILNRLSQNSCAEIQGNLRHSDVDLDPGDPK